jgi:thymidylate synthase
MDLWAKNIPCLQLAEFLYRDGRLNLIAVFRSHDFKGAYVANMYGLNALLQQVARETGLTPGSITTISIACHYYKQ